MADAPNAQRHQSSSSAKSSSPNHQQLLQGDASSWSPNSSPKLRKNHDSGDHGNHHNKKSVLMKVKEKARKLKRSFSGKKHREEHESRSPYATPPGSTGGLQDKEKEEPEFFGSPLKESEAAPEADDKQAAKEHPREANTASSKKHSMTCNVEQKEEEHPSAMSGSLGSANNTATTANGSSRGTDSEPHGLTPSTPGGTEIGTLDANKLESSSEAQENTTSSLQSQDKGVSVKEYLMQKFEPGEDERALSQVITQTISPRRERMREAMNSILRSDEPSQSTSKTSNSELDVSPTASSSNRNVGAASNPSHSLEPNLASASNPSQTSTSTAGSRQNQNAGASSTASSNLKPDSGSNQSDSNPKPSSSPGVHAHCSANATQVPASTSGHEVTKDEKSPKDFRR